MSSSFGPQPVRLFMGFVGLGGLGPVDDGHVGGGGLASRREGASDAFVFTIASSFFSAQRATGDGRWSTWMMRRLDFKWTAWNNPKVISKCRNRSRHTMQLCRCQSAILTHRVCVLGGETPRVPTAKGEAPGAETDMGGSHARFKRLSQECGLASGSRPVEEEGLVQGQKQTPG